MPLDPEIAEALRLRSRDSAAAFLEDFDHTRDLLSRKLPTRTDARHLSAILRRLIIEGDLQTIANPRVGEISIIGPDLSLAYLSVAQKKPIAFYAIAFLGLGTETIYSVRKSLFDNFDHSSKIGKKAINIDKYRDQSVIWFDGKWISRREIIRYVANEKSGIHSQGERKFNNEHISLIETTMEIRTTEEIYKISMLDPPSIAPRSTYRPDTLNPVLLEIILSANAIFTSPDIIELAACVRKEIS